ncbi:MAG: cytochrome c [Pseudomonadota bacterium]
MRELWAKRIAIFTGLLVATLALVFAWQHNPPKKKAGGTPIHAPAASQNDLIESGRKVYEELGCARCHAIAGQGNPRHPLDGVGAVLSAEELVLWITAPEEMREMLPESVFRVKQAYRTLTQARLDALVAYLKSLQDTPPAEQRESSRLSIQITRHDA